MSTVYVLWRLQRRMPGDSAAFRHSASHTRSCAVSDQSCTRPALTARLAAPALGVWFGAEASGKKSSDRCKTRNVLCLATRTSWSAVLPLQVLYCSSECRQAAADQYHRVLCLGPSQEDPDHPINKLKDAWRWDVIRSSVLFKYAKGVELLFH